MNTEHARQKWFPCYSPDGLLTRADAVNLIHKHAANGPRSLMLLADLTDAQIRVELPTAWLREHQQRDLFRDATVAVANDEYCPPTVWATFKDVLGALFR